MATLRVLPRARTSAQPKHVMSGRPHPAPGQLTAENHPRGTFLCTWRSRRRDAYCARAILRPALICARWVPHICRSRDTPFFAAAYACNTTAR